MIWIGLAVWVTGVLVGVMLTGTIIYLFFRQDPRRLGDLVKLIMSSFTTDPEAPKFVKLYVALFDTRRASKVFAYATAEDIGDGLMRYIRGNATAFELKVNPGFNDGDSASSKDES